MYDSHRRVCFEFMLFSENFQIYKFRSETPLYLGINLCHFYKMIKSIKKKDSIVLFINEDNLSDLGIRVVPKENNRVTTSFIKIQNIQNLEVIVPKNYSNCIIVPSNEYQKLCKDMSTISNTVSITAWKYYMKFSCDAGSVYSREVSFGELDADSDSDDDETEVKYTDVFNTEQLSRIVKISGLGNNIQVFVKQGLPMLFKTNIGNLGKISIFIKSKSQLEQDYPTLR
jgi:proliferating cell nuclear antigen